MPVHESEKLLRGDQALKNWREMGPPKREREGRMRGREQKEEESRGEEEEEKEEKKEEEEEKELVLQE